MHPETAALLEKLLVMLRDDGEKKSFPLHSKRTDEETGLLNGESMILNICTQFAAKNS